MRRLVLWGHHIDEYRDMFQLSKLDLTKRLLEYNCGPSAVNVETKDIAATCVSCDPWFDIDTNTLKQKMQTNFDKRIQELHADEQLLDVSRYGSLEKLIDYRRAGMDIFIADYDQGRVDKRYIAGSEFPLPFQDFSFDFALCANNIFSDIEYQTVDYHMQVIQELARVAKEVRIFPLVNAHGDPSSLLGPVLLRLHQAHYGVEVRDVDYRLYPKGNAMLKVWALQCSVSI